MSSLAFILSFCELLDLVLVWCLINLEKFSAVIVSGVSSVLCAPTVLILHITLFSSYTTSFRYSVPFWVGRGGGFFYICFSVLALGLSSWLKVFKEKPC